MASQNFLHLPDFGNFAKPEIARYGFYLEIEREGGLIGPPNPLEYQELILNPQSIRTTEPDASVVTPTQGGGVYIESNGWSVFDTVISGTTGHLPPGHSVTLAQADRSGFADFHRLRWLFRKFKDLRQANKAVTLHYMDFKSDEFWWIEPSSFAMDRKGFSYHYTISFKRIRPSADRKIQTKLAESLIKPPTPQAVAASVRRLGELRSQGTAFAGKMSGYMKVSFQNLTSKINDVVGVYSDVTDGVVRYTFTEPLGALRSLFATVDTVFSAIDEARDLPVRLRREANAFGLEVIELAEALTLHAQSTFGDSPGSYLSKVDRDYSTSRGVQGGANDLVSEDPANLGSPDGSLLLDRVGLRTVIPNLDALIKATVFEARIIQRGDTIFDLARRFYGSPQYFLILVRFNGLQAPYIVADPTNKPPGTLAWGDRINCPTDEQPESKIDGLANEAEPPTFAGSATGAGSLVLVVDDARAWREDQLVGYVFTALSGIVQDERRVIVGNTATTFTLNRELPQALAVGDRYVLSPEVFHARPAPNPQTVAFGKDLLLVWRATSAGPRADLCLNARKDLAMVSGLENFDQAMLVLMQTPQGSNMFHPERGLAQPVGRPLLPTQQLLYAFAARASLYQDPRVEAVLAPRFQGDGSTVELNVKIKPRYAKKTQLFSRRLRG